MDPFEIRECLDTFSILADRREQNTSRARERFQALGDPARVTLDYGDYCGQITLPDGRALYDTSARIFPACVVERKMSLDELAANFTRSRARFKAEFERATAHGAKVFLLVEGASWEAIENHRYRSKYNPVAFRASLLAWSIRYNMTPIFCKAGSSGKLIRDVLYREIKERLENGVLQS